MMTCRRAQPSEVAELRGWIKERHYLKSVPQGQIVGPASDIIDWSITSKSIFGRKKPLAPATMRRILVGLERAAADGHERARAVDGYVLDIHFRMLQPLELARAMGFTEKYEFASSRATARTRCGKLEMRSVSILPRHSLPQCWARMSREWPSGR